MKDSSNCLTRRETIGVLGLGLMLPPRIAKASSRPALAAIAFDAFPIFDPRPITQKVVALSPDRGRELAQTWSSKLFGTMWLYTAAGRYASFDEIADNALRHSANALGLALADSVRDELVGAYSSLDVWPDVKPALESLRNAGTRLAFLSNLSETNLHSNIDRNGLAASFDHVLSTDRVRAFKPAPKAYAMAMDAFGLPKSRIGFAAFGGWDAAGAAWFGYRTAWVNRLESPTEGIGPGPETADRGMGAVTRLAGIDAR